MSFRVGFYGTKWNDFSCQIVLAIRSASRGCFVYGTIPSGPWKIELGNTLMFPWIYRHYCTTGKYLSDDLLGNVEMMDETVVVVDIVIVVMDTRVGVLALEFRT
jgi:hypothetical protein